MTMLEQRPQTFAERGIAVPFTAPMLIGARARQLPGEPRNLVIPAFSGRGLYILTWSDATPLALPTLHDEALWRDIMGLSELTPRTMRAAARRVAMAGFAGRKAALAAVAAEQAYGQAYGTALAELRARQSGWPTTTILETLACEVAEVGIPPGAGQRLQARIATLDRFSKHVAAAVEQADAQVQADWRSILSLAQVTTKTVGQLAERLATILDRLLDNPLSVEGVAKVTVVVGQIEHVLDGWDHVAALVASAGTSAMQRLREVLIGLPAMPVEADGWMAGSLSDHTGMSPQERLVGRQSWQPEAQLAFIQDAERARALAP